MLGTSSRDLPQEHSELILVSAGSCQSSVFFQLLDSEHELSEDNEEHGSLEKAWHNTVERRSSDDEYETRIDEETRGD